MAAQGNQKGGFIKVLEITVFYCFAYLGFKI